MKVPAIGDRVIVRLSHLEAASSRIPSVEGCPSDVLRDTMEGRMLELSGNRQSR